MDPINYNPNQPPSIKVNISVEKTLPLIYRNYNLRSSLQPSIVATEYKIANFILDKLTQYSRINFEDLIETINKTFCVEAINGALLDTLLTKKGVTLDVGYITIYKKSNAKQSFL